MKHPHSLTRRAVLKQAGLAALALPLLSPLSSSLSAAESTGGLPASADRSRGLKLGVASISLRDLPVASAAEVLRQLQVGYVSAFRTHAPFEKGTPQECRAAAEAFRKAGIVVSTTSVVNLTTDEAATRKAFENVKAAGLSLMTIRPAVEALPLVERMVREYGIAVAIHNHGPEDELYPSPYDALKRIESMDPRVGLCLDVGHTLRAGVDPAEAVHRCAPRLLDLHLKDTLALPGATKDIPTEVGRGKVNVKAILAALLEIKYSGAVAFEYERMGVNPITGLAECVGYVRGMLAGMSR